MYESHGIPKLYACFERHKVPGKAAETKILAPIGTSFHVAFDIFKKFFKLKTGVHWDQRNQNWILPERTFQYRSPAEGEPQGVMAGNEQGDEPVYG